MAVKTKYFFSRTSTLNNNAFRFDRKPFQNNNKTGKKNTTYKGEKYSRKGNNYQALYAAAVITFNRKIEHYAYRGAKT